jgi:hypothetical protein
VAAAVKMEDFKAILQFQLSANRAVQKPGPNARKVYDEAQDWE